MTDREKRFFLLVAADEDKSRLSAPSAFDRAVYRLANRRWGLNVRTRNRKAMRPGDEVVIYASGKRQNGMTFVGHAAIASKPVPLTHDDRYNLDSPRQREPTTCCEAIQLRQARLFREPVPIKSVYRRFDWVRSPDSPRWAAALMGGAMHLTRHDFTVIVAAGMSKRRLVACDP
ncbi:MAG: EVE domain-containing protein [Blastocatellia bacterium]|nr:EVE domain-containing protein [Blastocatellia bacterium]